jgi:hypothetical protein
MTPRLRLASLLVCGLFVAEDPVVVAVRTRSSDWPLAGIVLDVGLAIVMVAYNFISSRYVVSVGSAAEIVTAMEQVDTQRAERIARIQNRCLRGLRRAASHLNPFNLIKTIGEHLGRSVDRIGASVSRRRLARVGNLFGDLGAVNVLGVPGAGLALSTLGRPVSRAQSLRHCVLFVASWFVGARIVGLLVGAAHDLPVVGRSMMTVTGAIGVVFATVTDVTRPIGACTLALMVVAIAHYAGQVDRNIRANTRSTTS